MEGIDSIYILRSLTTHALYLMSLISSMFWRQMARRGNILSCVLMMLQKEAITWFLVSLDPDLRISSSERIVLFRNFGNLIMVLLSNLTATATNWGELDLA